MLRLLCGIGKEASMMYTASLVASQYVGSLLEMENERRNQQSQRRQAEG
jgi:hypothetical protein